MATTFSAKKRLSVVFQAEEAECGLACLAMLCSYHQGIYSLNQLRQIYGSTRGGISLTELVRFASSIGLRLVPEKADSVASIPVADFPCIALWDQHHLVVLDITKSGEIVLHDPAFGTAIISIADANRSFSFQYLKVRVITSIFKKRPLEAGKFCLTLPSGVGFADIGVLSTLVTLVLLLISSFFAVGNAQVQDVFFNWIVEMQMKQWSTPLAYVQIITGLVASLSLFALALYVAKKYTDISLKWNSYIYRRLLSLPEEYYLSRRTGDTISRFNYVDSILRSSQSSLVKLVVAFINLAILFFILLMTNLVLLLLAVLAAILAIGIAIAFNPRQRAKQQQVQHASAHVERMLYELITDFDQIRLEGREQYYLQSISAYESRRLTLSNQLSYSYAREEFILQVLDNTSSVLLLIAAGIVIMAGNMTLGQYAAIDVLVSTSLSPLMNLSGVIRTLQETNIAFNRLGDIIDSPIDRRFDIPSRSSLDKAENDSIIELDSVNFSYSLFSGRILSGCSISLSAKDFPLLIQGSSGSGKSTLARLLSGRSLPTSGLVKIYGYDISKISVTDVNKLALMVDGLPFIRGASILDNLRLGSCATPDFIMDVISDLGIKDLPLFSIANRRVSSSFRDLSGGELILIQIIRALARKPNILILDESIAAISPAYRSKVVEGIIKYCPYSVFISHEIPESIIFGSKYRLVNGRLQSYKADSGV